MWQEARANDKRIKEIMVDHRKRAERRRAYYDSRLGDPQQLIRVIGVSSKVYPNAEQFYYHENIENLMHWQGNTDIRIDRFDGRSLLDYIPPTNNRKGGYLETSRNDKEMMDELNFERYHDLIEAERLNITENERLLKVDEEWTKLLDRHQEKMALLDKQNFGFNYNEEEDDDDNEEKESQLLKEVDILQYVDELTDKDKQILNEMSGKYGIKSYARLLRIAKKDRDEELNILKRKTGDNNNKSRNSNERRRNRRKIERENKRNHSNNTRYKRRHSPTYEPYNNYNNSHSEDSSEEEEQQQQQQNVIIEFGSNTLDQDISKEEGEKEYHPKQSTPIAPIEKKLTPMEKLKLKMRAGLEKQIVSDEKEKRQKEKEKEIENLQELARNQGLPINAYMRPEPPTRESQNKHSSSPSTKQTSGDTQNRKRYRSPSSSPTRNNEKSYNRRRRSKSPPKRRYRSPSFEDNSSSRKKYDHRRERSYRR